MGSHDHQFLGPKFEEVVEMNNVLFFDKLGVVGSGGHHYLDASVFGIYSVSSSV